MDREKEDAEAKELIFQKIGELRKMGDKAIPELLNLLDNEDKDVQWHAEYALEKIGKEHPEKENIHKLKKLLDAKEKSVKIGAVLALSQSATKKEVKNVSHKLIKLLNDENWFVRREVTWTLHIN